jgi:hypothetical protein
LKRESKAEKTNKPYEVISLKSENKVSFITNKRREKRLRFDKGRKKVN